MGKLSAKAELGKTGLSVPPLIFGTSCLGNLYRALPDETKLEIMRQWFEWVEPPVVPDSAGKYGAGLALETMGRGLEALGVASDQVLVSNKLGWKRVPLSGPEPTFEPGAWADIEHDAVQCISYDGIVECWEQGCELLGDAYRPALASVHDPDEYLAAAEDEADAQRRFDDVVGAYRALGDLKKSGQVRAVGIGAKDWQVIRRVADAVDLDWVMFACSLTVYTHPAELIEFMARLHSAGIGMINSAVFNAGFLIGGTFFDYCQPDPVADAALFAWRERFLGLCRAHEVDPVHVCVQFGMSVPGVVSVALNTSKPARIKDNAVAVQAEIPNAFWHALRDEGILAKDYPYLT